MSFSKRLLLLFTLVAAFALGASAQQTEPAAVAAPSAATREQFRALLRQHAPEVSRVLALDPALLSNERFLGRYPDIERFLAAHPEIRSNPQGFLPELDLPIERVRVRGPFEDAMETLSILFVFVVIGFALAWLLRTIIEQKRWNQLSMRQGEVHARILDRFTNNEELLTYITSPAGEKFLGSAPLTVETEPARGGTPLARVMWSIQIGVVAAAAGLGTLIVSLRFKGETAEGFFAIGAIAFFLGAGFIASAFVSIFLSRRLGIWRERAAEPGLVP